MMEFGHVISVEQVNMALAKWGPLFLNDLIPVFAF